MELNAYLMFNGQCEAAFKFYEKCLGGKIVAIQTFGDSPMAEKVPPEWRDKVIHARLVAAGKVLMGSDAPEHFEQPTGFAVSIGVTDPADADRIFNALSENGKIQMPIQKTFWSVRFGMFIDQFGIPWMVNCEQAA